MTTTKENHNTKPHNNFQGEITNATTKQTEKPKTDPQQSRPKPRGTNALTYYLSFLLNK